MGLFDRKDFCGFVRMNLVTLGNLSGEYFPLIISQQVELCISLCMNAHNETINPSLLDGTPYRNATVDVGGFLTHPLHNINSQRFKNQVAN